MRRAALESREARDARPSRSARSRQAICDACLDLMQEGVLQPSADQVAARSGVSRRSIFNHFADLAELYDAVLDAGMRRCAPLLEEVPADHWLIPQERRPKVYTPHPVMSADEIRSLVADAIPFDCADLCFDFGEGSYCGPMLHNPGGTPAY